MALGEAGRSRPYSSPVAAIEWAHSRGMAQVVLWSKSRNDGAQRLFAKLGFRDTMIEMTLDGNAEGQ